MDGETKYLYVVVVKEITLPRIMKSFLEGTWNNVNSNASVICFVLLEKRPIDVDTLYFFESISFFESLVCFVLRKGRSMLRQFSSSLFPFSKCLTVRKFESPSESPRVPSSRSPKVRSSKSSKVQESEVPEAQNPESPKFQKSESTRVRSSKSQKVQEFEVPRVRKFESWKFQ